MLCLMHWHNHNVLATCSTAHYKRYFNCVWMSVNVMQDKVYLTIQIFIVFQILFPSQVALQLMGTYTLWNTSSFILASCGTLKISTQKLTTCVIIVDTCAWWWEGWRNLIAKLSPVQWPECLEMILKHVKNFSSWFLIDTH